MKFYIRRIIIAAIPVIIATSVFAETNEYKPPPEKVAQSQRLAKAVDVVYIGMPKQDLYDAFTRDQQKGYYRKASEEYIAFADWKKKLQYSKAISDCNKAIGINPNDAYSFFTRGWVYYKKGQYDQAISDFANAIKLAPEYAQAYGYRGNAYAEQGLYGLAIFDLTKAIKLNPNYAFAYYNRAKIFQENGKYAMAISDLNKAIDADPNYSYAYYHRAIIYQDKGKHGKAISGYTKAIELNPDLAPSAYANRAYAYYLKKKYDKSWQDVHKAEALGEEFSPEFIKDLKKDSGREK